MPVCKLCAREATLIKAHVIPRSFWAIDAARPSLMLTNTKGVYPKRVRIGVYDQTIVCDCCERGFSDYDSYAADLLLNRANEFEAVRDDMGRSTGFLLRRYDYSRLKLFTIAVLWRAAASSHPFFSRVQLGPFEARAREMLQRRDPGDAATFAVLFSVWSGTDSPIMDPSAGHLGEVRTYRFYLGRFIAHIKVDRRPFPWVLAKAALSPEEPLHLISRELAASKDFQVMKRVLAAQQPG
jgi:hypothetical protein